MVVISGRAYRLPCPKAHSPKRNPARGLPSKYPAPQPVTIIPIAEGSVAGVAIDATTLGMSEKNAPVRQSGQTGSQPSWCVCSCAFGPHAPAATPVRITKTIKGPTLPLRGQTSNKLIAFVTKAIMSELIGPIRSASNPKAIRPTADARLNPAASPAEDE
jgi:hypothetical protein